MRSITVGRSHRLVFHQLRTRLSEFGRWNHDQLPRDRVKCAYDLLLPSASLQWVCYRPQFHRQKCTDIALRSEGEPERTYSSPGTTVHPNFMTTGLADSTQGLDVVRR